MKAVAGKIMLLFIFVVALFSFQTSRVSAQDSYELFWPVVAGRTSEDPLYSLKLLKEGFRGAFIFSSAKKSEYSLFLSEKRLVEFENLVKIKKDVKSAQKTLDRYNSELAKTVNYFDKALAGESTAADVKQRILKSFDNQLLVLGSVQKDLDEQLKSPVSSLMSFLETEKRKLR